MQAKVLHYAFGKLEYEGMFPFGDLEQIQKEVDFNLRNKESEALISEKTNVLEQEKTNRETYSSHLSSQLVCLIFQGI